MRGRLIPDIPAEDPLPLLGLASGSRDPAALCDAISRREKAPRGGPTSDAAIAATAATPAASGKRGDDRSAEADARDPWIPAAASTPFGAPPKWSERTESRSSPAPRFAMRAVRAADSRTPSAARDPKRTRPSVNSAARRKKASDAGGGAPAVDPWSPKKPRDWDVRAAAPFPRSRSWTLSDSLSVAPGSFSSASLWLPGPAPRPLASRIPAEVKSALRFAPESAGGRILPSSAAFPRRRRRSSLSLGSPGPWYPAPPAARGSPRLLTRRMAMATTPRTPTTLMGASMNEEMGRSSRRLSSIACCTASSVVSNSFSASACASASSASFAAASSAARASRDARAASSSDADFGGGRFKVFCAAETESRTSSVSESSRESSSAAGFFEGAADEAFSDSAEAFFEDVFFEDAEDFAAEDSDFVAATAVTSAASLDALASPTAPMSAGAATI